MTQSVRSAVLILSLVCLACGGGGHGGSPTEPSAPSGKHLQFTLIAATVDGGLLEAAVSLERVRQETP